MKRSDFLFKCSMLSCGVIALFALTDSAPAADFALSPATKSDSVTFRSNAKLEFVEGSTTTVLGAVHFDASAPTDSVGGVIQVDLRTLDTGIKMRDEHMRENHLETAKFPFAYFALQSLIGAPAEWKPDSLYEMNAKGEFYIHGVRRKLTAHIFARVSGQGEHQTISIKAGFSINLDAFGIPRPRALLLKLAETMNIEVIFKGYSGLAEPPIQLPDWPELP